VTENYRTGLEHLPNGDLQAHTHLLNERKRKMIDPDTKKEFMGKEFYVTSSKKARKPPEKITDETLEVLIGNSVFGYIDRPGAMSLNDTRILSALLELKEYRQSSVQPSKTSDDV